jgi:hypothetical protein
MLNPLGDREPGEADLTKTRSGDWDIIATV